MIYIKLVFGLPHQKIGVADQKSVWLIQNPSPKSVFLMKNRSSLSKIGLFNQRSVCQNRSSLSKIKESGVQKINGWGGSFLMFIETTLAGWVLAS